MKRYRGIPVFVAPLLISIISSRRSRGMALGWFILIRKPDATGYVTSTTGRKPVLNLLEHEAEHIKRQRDLGIFKWFWKYWRDGSFARREEVLATRAEPNYDIKSDILKDLL